MASSNTVNIIWGKFPADANRGTFLNLILAEELKISFLEAEIAKTSRGKPFLVNMNLGVQFSWSHTGDYFLLAWCRHIYLGADIEDTRADRKWKKIAERFFSNHEANAVKDQNSFFRIWVLKESVVKLSGQGMDAEFSEFSVVDENGQMIHQAGSVSEVFYLNNFLVAAVSYQSLQKPNWAVKERA